jgi:hypothetical protein
MIFAPQVYLQLDNCSVTLAHQGWIQLRQRTHKFRHCPGQLLRSVVPPSDVPAASARSRLAQVPLECAPRTDLGGDCCSYTRQVNRLGSTTTVRCITPCAQVPLHHGQSGARRLHGPFRSAQVSRAPHQRISYCSRLPPRKQPGLSSKQIAT